MNQENTPKSKLEYINETVLNTPQPQASSTVERKGVLSYRFYSGKSEVNKSKDDIKKKTKELLDDVPTRDTDTMSDKLNSSQLSSGSSLGILSLENMADFQDYLDNVTKNTSLAQDMKSSAANINVNEKLQMQRILAQKALERADAKTTSGGLPSYLLKPSDTPGKNNMTSNTMPRNESTINMSDLEKSLPRNGGIKTSDMSEQLSFEAKEISARSSSFGTKYITNSETEVIDLTGQSPVRGMSGANDFSSKCQSIYGKIRQSDISIAEMCDRSSRMGIHTQPLGTLPLPDIETINISSGSENSWCHGTQDSLMIKLQNELFTPAELAGDKLLEDELSWRKEKDIIPVDSYTTAKRAAGENAYLELSDFSGYIDNEDLSLKSSGNISFGEFFQRGTEDVDKLDLKASPEKKYAPIPLINLTSSSCKFDELLDVSVPRTNYPRQEETQVILPPSTQFSRISTDSIVSVTRIAEVVAQMDIGETPSRVMDALMKNTAPKSTNLRKIVSSSNLSQNPSLTTSSSSSTLWKTQSSKLTDSSKTITQVSSVDASLKENSQFTGKSPQIKKSTESVLKDATNRLEQKDLQSDVIKNVSSDGDWTDAKPNVDYTLQPNKTLSSITESPSFSCSELDFSEDNPDSADNTLHKHTEIWLEIEDENEPRKLYTNIPQRTALTVNSLTSHWLLVKVHVKDTNSLTNVARIELFNEEGLLKSQAKEQLEFKITSLITGKIELLFRIDMTDMVTKAQKQIDHRLVFESEKPQLQLSTDKLDFGTNCEGCFKKMNVTVYNKGSADLPLTIIISQKCEKIYVFTTEVDNDKSDEKDSEGITMTTCVIPAVGFTKLFIDMCCPKLAELNCSTNHIDLQGSLQVYTSEPFKMLKEIDLIGRIGLTKIQFKYSSSPLVLLSGQTKAIPVRNSGKVVMELTPKIVDETSSPINTYFTVGESSIVLKPGQIGNVNVSFSCKDKVVGSIKSILRLEYHRGPGFVFPVEGITEDKDTLAVTKSPLLGKSPRTSAVASRLSKDRRSVEVKSVSPSTSDRPSTRNSQAGRASANSSDSGTLSYLQGGKLPIESTRTELIWGCVKPGKTVSQEFILRNRCSQRVRLQATINGQGFKFIKDQTETGTTLSLMLHSLESRTITVNFSPNSKGAAAAKLMFLPIENDAMHSKRQMISLYGYGGYSNVDFQKVAKDPTGKMWLSFGRLDYRGNLQQTLILRNTGSLAAFACLNVACKALYPFMDSSVQITPTEVVIPPNKEVEVCISFTPRQEDFRYIQTSNAVSEIASINVLTGSEPTRGRIRRLFNKMTHQGILPQMTNEFLIPKLSATLPQEHMPLDLLNCKESPGAMKELLQDLITREISLTIEHDPDKSGLASVLGADDTCMFHSLCNETAQTTLDASYGQFESQTQRRASGGFCTVEPMKIMLTPPMKTEDTVLVTSRHSRPMPFEISIPNGELQVSPNVGVVPPGETTVLSITCSKTQPKPLQFFKVMVYVENEVMEIEVKIHFVQARRS